MAVPKRKTSKARRDSRRSSNWKLSIPGIVACPQCHEPKMPHHVCPEWPTGFARIAAITTASRSSRLKKPNNLFDLKVNRGCVSRILFLRYSEICDRIAYIFYTEGYLRLYDTHSVRRYGRG